MSGQGEHVSVRDRTRDDLLGLIRSSGGTTRPELVAVTKMSRSTVNQAVGRLLDEGRVYETVQQEKGPGSGSGRPATRLVATTSSSPVAGIDFGHNHVRVAVADERGVLLGQASREIDVDLRAFEALDLAAEMLAGIVRDSGLEAVGSVVAGIPGPLDARTGRVRSPTILSSWVELAPRDELQRRLGVPVRVENDAVLGAYGELRRGAGRGHANFLYVKASHGIGAGLVIGGQPYMGATGIAGEIGHINLPGRIESCRCGNRGCLEAVISVESLRDQIALTHPAWERSSIDLSAEADEVTTRILNESGRTLGRVLAQLCDLLNPDALIVGGELGALGAPLLEGVRSSISRYSQPAIAAAITVSAAELGERAELEGALELASAWMPVDR